MADDLFSLCFALAMFGVYGYALVKVRNGWLTSKAEPPRTRTALRQVFTGLLIGVLMYPLAGLAVLGLVEARVGFLIGFGVLGGSGLLIAIHGWWRARNDPRFVELNERWSNSRTGKLC